ncbi:MAG: hypothetical protein JXR96_12600 [Deltaproteobacteria bacterium]|nr:hypothetical protein [Deltaproteobacteria bacterium]
MKKLLVLIALVAIGLLMWRYGLFGPRKGPAVEAAEQRARAEKKTGEIQKKAQQKVNQLMDRRLRRAELE